MAADRSRLAAALDYLQRLKSGVGEFVGGVGSNLADRARAAGGLAYEALTTDPNIGRMTTAEFSQAAADRAPTPRLDQAARDIGTIGRAIVTQPVETGKAIVGGEIDRFKGAFASPQVAGQYAGSLIDPTRLAAALRHRIPISELDVYHGTPHTYAPTEANPLGEFDASKIGTGEGAQAYGHGIYLAENPRVAGGYRNVLSDTLEVTGNAEPLEKRIAQMALTFGNNTPEGAIQWISKHEGKGSFHTTPAVTPELAKSVKQKFEDGTFKQGGSLYKADLPDEMIDRMLDWDKPIKDQPETVQNAMRQAFGEYAVKYAIGNEMDWKRFQSMFGFKNEADFSERLRQAGIPGIKYLDAGSRGQGGSGTRNFVVFPGEEKKVRILERNGQPAPERIAQALEAAPTTARRPTALPTIKPGDVVDGYKVRPDIPNQSSIAASLDNYKVLPGIRSINMTEFDPQYVRSISPDKLDSRTRKLMDEISQSKELNPLIVAYDSKGPYIIEGGHRFDALAASKAKSVPAMVVIDMDDPPR